MKTFIKENHNIPEDIEKYACFPEKIAIGRHHNAHYDPDTQTGPADPKKRYVYFERPLN